MSETCTVDYSCLKIITEEIYEFQEHIHKNLRLASFFLVMMVRDVLKPVYMSTESEPKSSFWMILETHISHQSGAFKRIQYSFMSNDPKIYLESQEIKHNSLSTVLIPWD